MSASESTSPASGLRRELGPLDATVVVAGAIIGIGIFVNPSNVARILPAPGWIVAVWVAGGALALAGGFVYAELGSRLPKVGGQYVYLVEGYGGAGRFVGFLYGFALLFVINSGGMAAVASALAGYVDRTFVPLGTLARTALAIGALGLLAEVNVRGVVAGARTNNALMALKLAGIVALAALAALFGRGSATDWSAAAPGAVTLTAFFAALVPVVFAYGGWQNCGSLAAEIRDPRRTLVLANVAGVLLVVVVYVGLVLAYLWVLPPAEVASSTALAADVARALVGPAGARFVGALIAVSCLGFLAVMTMTGPRLYYAMATDGLFLERAARLHPRHGTPAFLIRLQAAVAVALLVSQTYDQLLSYVVFCDALFFALTAAALFRFRARDGARPDAAVFRAPGHPFTTALFVAINLAVVLNCFAAAPRQAALGCGVLAIGAASFVALRARSSRA